MASSLLPRLLRRARAGAPPFPFPFPFPSVPLLSSSNQLTLSPDSLPQITESQIPIFPTFPLFSHLHPIWDPTPLPDPVLRADSVKKKRKRKMNKHKLRKLRKQLRLRT